MKWSEILEGCEAVGEAEISVCGNEEHAGSGREMKDNREKNDSIPGGNS